MGKKLVHARLGGFGEAVLVIVHEKGHVEKHIMLDHAVFECLAGWVAEGYQYADMSAIAPFEKRAC